MIGKRSYFSIILVVVAIVSVLLFIIFFGKVTYSEGFRVGTLYKCSYKGLIWKTWECELIPEGMVVYSNSGVPRGWKFSFCTYMFNKTALDMLLNAPEGSKVKVYYEQKIFNFPWEAKTVYCVKAVEIISSTT
jgi:hypothetical protein